MEREDIFNRYVSSKIGVKYAPANDCLFGVVALAFNALTDSPEHLTGIDVQTISEKANIAKGEMEMLLEELNRRTKIKGLDIVHFPGDWTKESAYDLYTKIIDHNGLVFVGVDSLKWYGLFGLKGPKNAGYHALLMNGYETKLPKYVGRRVRNIILRDPSFRRGIKVELDLLYPMVWPKYSKEFGVLAFFQKS